MQQGESGEITTVTDVDIADSDADGDDDDDDRRLADQFDSDPCLLSTECSLDCTGQF